MKKSLVLAMAMALGVTASAYAANPFSDVPAGHWAYDSISKLAAAGVIEGYGDDTFRGDRLMTRYEMAQIVARAMAKGANVDKLAAEFADELEKLNVRVSALEKKSDNVKITGKIRLHWTGGKNAGAHWADSTLRTQLTFNGKVNDNWNYIGMIENRQVIHENGNGNGFNYVGEDARIQFKRAYMSGRLGGMQVNAGRFPLDLGHSESDIFSDQFDGIQVAYGNKVRLGAYYGKPAHFDWRQRANRHDIGYKKGWGISIEGDIGKNITLWTGYDKFVDNTASAATHGDDRGVWNIGGSWRLKDFTISGLFAKASDRTAVHKKGAYIDVNYKGAKASVPGSWGVQVKYYHWGDGVVLGGQHGWNNFNPADNNGWKGFKVGANYAVAKNMVAEIAYWDTKGLSAPKDKSRTLWTALNVTF